MIITITGLVAIIQGIFFLIVFFQGLHAEEYYFNHGHFYKGRSPFMYFRQACFHGAMVVVSVAIFCYFYYEKY